MIDNDLHGLHDDGQHGISEENHVPIALAASAALVRPCILPKKTVFRYMAREG
jgi:hypothetical protein